jgi:glycosyltransferase involved in cell wall biosynthesis
MRINILTPGRFHVCDLARELSMLGHEVRFYSYVPKFRTSQFGLPPQCARPVWTLGLHYLIARLTGGSFLGDKANNFSIWLMDLIVSETMEPCDIVIAMSGCFYRSVVLAKKKWNAKILIERGSRHIQSQKKIMDQVCANLNKKAVTVSNSAIFRELRDYAVADIIVVPSHHVFKSMIEEGVSAKKIFRNPYGTSLIHFKPTIAPPLAPLVICMAGTWSYRKGCDLLSQALYKSTYQLVHVGILGDCPFPRLENFKHIGKVDQTQLALIYAQAHLFVLPSREEGMALVLGQALACGLPIVCSDKTGGEDLMEILTPTEKKLITVVPSNDVESLKRGIEKVVEIARQQKGLRQISNNSLEKMSWRAYGNRYNQFLETLTT